MSATLANYFAILPEILLVALIFIVLGYNSFVTGANGRTAGLITAWGTVIIAVAYGVLVSVNWDSVAAWQSYETLTAPALNIPVQHWGGMISGDPIGVVFRMMFLAALLLTTLLSLDTDALQQAEYFALLIAATIGFNLMSVSADMVMLIIALETASISLYLLAAYAVKDSKSTEAGMKYFVYGAFASAIMLYGMSLLYGLTGRTNIYAIAEEIRELNLLTPNISVTELSAFLVTTAVLLVVGFGFKISAIPFHWWAPDVYEGAPTQVTGFASTASKAAGFALFIRVFSAGAVGAPTSGSAWWAMLVAISIITMIVGNMLAIYQTNIKRMLAYSSVAQAGYVLIALVAFTPEAAGAAMFYLLMYVLTNIAAFGVIVLVGDKTGSSDMKDLYGLSRRSPYLALAMLFALLSLGGIPPTAGFFGKFFIFKAAVDAGLWGLALVGIMAAFISLYYYLSVVKYIYLYRDEERETEAIQMSRAAKLAMGLSVAGILWLGIFAGPAINWTNNAAQWFFSS
ncbi:MAG: NADH-quinone oxidoreductase subunit N [Candidatus Promineifilaceae bacterium]